MPVETINYDVLIPLGDRVPMRRETYTWHDGRLARIDSVWGDWTDAGGNLIGAWDGVGRLWVRPTVTDEQLQDLEARIATAVGGEVERLIGEAQPSGQVYCVGIGYSPGMPEDRVLWPYVALELASDRDGVENVSTLWHPRLMTVGLGHAVLPGGSDLAGDARLLAREVTARDDRFLHRFFDAVGRHAAASGVELGLPATEDMLVVVIDDSEGITRDTVLRHAPPRARNLLVESPWLP